MVAVVSCPLPLGIYLSFPLGVTVGQPMFSLYLGVMMRVHMGVGGRGQGSSFRVIRLQLSCLGSKTYIHFPGIHNIPMSPCRPLVPQSLSASLSFSLDAYVPE